jgi:predicted negative regulator of RcsB-dependent stress response
LTDYLTEQEQIQQIKTWLKQYGPTIVLGILLALIMTTGWRYWQNYHNKMLMHASGIYDEMLALRAQNNASGASVQAQKLLTRYPKTPYADIASLLLARDAAVKKNYPDAIQKLTHIVDECKNPSLRQIARIRIARILLTEKKPDAALNLLKELDDNNYMGLVDEVRGDAYVIKKDFAAARKAYLIALQELPNAEVTRPMLEMKYTALAAA